MCTLVHIYNDPIIWLVVTLYVDVYVYNVYVLYIPPSTTECWRSLDREEYRGK